VGRAGEGEARLKAEIDRLREGLAAAESRAGELDALCAERDQLRQQLQQSADRQSAHEVDGDVLAKALEGVSPRAGWPWFESPRKAESALTTANKGDAEAADQQIASVQQEFSRERATLQTEVAKLRKENTLLRQYLENFGVQMIQM
jgi:phage shock protein A